MANLGWLIGIPLFIIAPCAIAVWLGTRFRRPSIAFGLTWIMTPVASLIITTVFWPVLRALTPSNNDGTGAIMIPFFGIATGLIAAIVAAVIVKRRGDRAVVISVVLDQHSAVGTNAEPNAAPDTGRK